MEQNKENLRRAIDQMPEYQPPEGLWHDLAELLDFEQKLEAPLQEMPVLTPPATVWEGLAARIEQTPELKPRSRIPSALKWLIGALLPALFIGWWMFQTNSEPPPPPAAAPEQHKPAEPIAQTIPDNKPATTPTLNLPNQRSPPRPQPPLAHHTEVVDDVLMMASRRADDPSYDIVETLCREALPVCEEPQFKQLKTELDDLTHAYSELKNALGNFADDTDMVTQLIEIERARYQILQQLIAMM